MVQSGWQYGGMVALALALGGQAARAADVETRAFSLTIDQKAAGSYSMTITRQDDGSVTMTGQANVSVRYYRVYKYTYTYQGTETWKDGRLLKLESTANDNGKAFAVSAWAEGDGLKVRSNGREHLTRAEVWTTTYWHPPDSRFQNQAVPLLDADTGKDINAHCQFIGSQRLSVAGQEQDCKHFRLTGGVTVDVWYDAQDHLVREEMVEDGHRTVFQLTRVQR
jgi:hypothetical protein